MGYLYIAFMVLSAIAGYAIARITKKKEKNMFKFQINERVRFLSSKDDEMIRKLKRRGHKVKINPESLTRGTIIWVKVDSMGVSYVIAADLICLVETKRDNYIFPL